MKITQQKKKKTFAGYHELKAFLLIAISTLIFRVLEKVP